MSDDPHDFEGLAAEYALGTLEGADLDRAIALEVRDPAFAADVQRWRLDMLILDDTAMPLEPTADLWSRIDSGLPATTRLVSEPEQSAGIWHRLAFWRGLGLATSLASVLLGIGLWRTLDRPPPSPTYVAVMSGDDGQAAAVVNAYADGTVEMIPLAQISVPQGRVIEVWTLQDRAQGPVSLGQIDRARRIKLDLSKLSRPDVNHLFELTLEPTGGSPTGKPTGPVLMKGLVARGI